MEEVRLEHPEFTQLSSEILGGGNQIRFTAHGSSMAPFIRNGDVVTVEPTENPDWRVGDIVFYRTECDALIAHRIVRIKDHEEKLRLQVRGDSSRRSEDVITVDQILGQIKILERGDKDIRINDGIWRVLGSLWVLAHPLPLLGWRFIRKVLSMLSAQPA